jgi:GNAT superfamily N-acetyltransferase
MIGFCAVLTQPHPTVKKLKRVHRLVILPDWQGIGIGKQFVSFVGQMYKNAGYKLNIVTSAKNMIKGLNDSPYWKLKHLGRHGLHTDPKQRPTSRAECRVASLSYIGK